MLKIYSYSLFIFILILLSISKVNAQVGSVWSGGIEAGPGFAKFGADAGDQQFKLGLVAGGFVTYSVINTFGVTLKALYAQKGTKFSDGGNTYKQSLNYVEVPLLARFFLNKEGKFRPNLFIGPSAGILLDSKTKRGNGESVSASNKERKNFKELDLGLTGGVGLNYLILNETRLLLDARYNYGLADIADPGKNTNNSIAVTFGMSFGL